MLTLIRGSRRSEISVIFYSFFYDYLNGFKNVSILHILSHYLFCSFFSNQLKYGLSTLIPH